jgi:tRNA C32,U32 (ribose-2'-O)-methylase TrmJ
VFDVIEYGDGWVYLNVDGDVKGWVSMDYVEIDVAFDTAMTLEEEQAKLEEERRRAEAAAEAERIAREAKAAEEAKASAEEKQKLAEDKLKATESRLKTANPEVNTFKVMFEALQEQANKCKRQIFKIAETDPEAAERLKAAMKALADSLVK